MFSPAAAVAVDAEAAGALAVVEEPEWEAVAMAAACLARHPSAGLRRDRRRLRDLRLGPPLLAFRGLRRREFRSQLPALVPELAQLLAQEPARLVRRRGQAPAQSALDRGHRMRSCRTSST